MTSLNTNLFRVTYHTGLVSDTNSMAASVEEFANEHFGSAWEEAQLMGATIVMNPQPEPEPQMELPVGEPDVDPENPDA